MTGAWRRWWPFALPILVAALLRGALTWDALDAPLLGDEATLQRLARTWDQYGVYVGEWPPVFPWLLTTLRRLVGDPENIAWMRALDTLASLLVVVATMALAHTLGGRRVALVAGWFAALDLALAIWSALLFTEALYVLVFMLALCVLARAFAGARVTTALLFLVGGLLGVGALVRAAGLVLLFAVAIGAAVARGYRPPEGEAPLARRAVAALLVVVAGLAVMLPWSVRNTQVLGASAWASPTGTGNVALGWSGARIVFERVGVADEDVYAAPLGGLRRWLERPGPSVPGPEVFAEGANMERWARERVVEVVTTHPGWAVRSRVLHVSELFSPLSFAHRALRLGQLEGCARRPWLRRALLVGGALTSVALFGLAVVGVARRRYPEWWWWIAASIALAHLVVPLAMFGISRFRAPLEPILIVFAALAFSRDAEPRAAGGRARVWVPALVLGGALIVMTPVVYAVIAG